MGTLEKHSQHQESTTKKRMIPIILTSFMFLMQIAEGSEPSLGNCPDLRGLKNFTVSNYIGTWHEYSKLFLIPEAFGKCVRATYSGRNDGSVGVFNEQISSLTGQYNFINGSATQADPQYAEFIVNFDSVPVQNSRPNYRVLSTDYQNFAIVYDCLDIFGIFKAESLWFLTRDQFPAQELIDEGYKMMTDWSLPVDSLSVTDRSGCENLPGF